MEDIVVYSEQEFLSESRTYVALGYNIAPSDDIKNGCISILVYKGGALSNNRFMIHYPLFDDSNGQEFEEADNVDEFFRFIREHKGDVFKTSFNYAKQKIGIVKFYPDLKKSKQLWIDAIKIQALRDDDRQVVEYKDGTYVTVRFDNIISIQDYFEYLKNRVNVISHIKENV